MTPAEESRLTRRLDRLLNRWERWALRLVRRTLSAWLDAVVQAVEQRGVVATLTALPELVSDLRTRDAHRAMLGKPPIGKNDTFLVGGKRMKYPGDPAGGAAQCCNCRCSVVWVPTKRRDALGG